MKKLIRAMLLAVMAFCFALPVFGSAEAATVAVLPLVNKTDNETAGQIYYQQTLNIFKTKPGFVVVDNDKLKAAVAANTTAGQLPSESQIAAIAKDGDVDFVICMELDVLEDSMIPGTNEDVLKMDLQGNAIAYNKITGKIITRRLYSDKEVPQAVTARWDWKSEEFARQVRLTLDKVLSTK